MLSPDNMQQGACGRDRSDPPWTASLPWCTS